MSQAQFIKGLLITTLIAFVISLGLSFLPQEAPFQVIIFGSLLFFSMLTVLHYFFSRKAVTFKNKGFYIGFVQMFTLIKMTLTILFVVLFVKLGKPESNWFILPYLLNYAIYTIFETSALMHVAEEKK